MMLPFFDKTFEITGFSKTPLCRNFPKQKKVLSFCEVSACPYFSKQAFFQISPYATFSQWNFALNTPKN